jgi:hypothetical protein
MKRLAELDAANSNVIREEAGTVSCSSCGEKFKIAGRKDGFSHCSDHKGHKALDESANLEECGMGMMPIGGMNAPHTPASINITADSGEELSHMLRDIMTLAGRGHAEPDADNMPVDAVAIDMAPPAEIDFDGGNDDNTLMRGMMDKLNAAGDEDMDGEEETEEGTDGSWDNSPNHATDIGHYSDATPKGNDLSSHADNERPKMNGGGNPYAMEEKLMADWKKFMTENSDDSLSFWKREAQKAGGAKNIDWHGIGIEHGKQGIVMNPPYGAGGRAVAQYDKGLEAGENFDPLKHIDSPTQGERDAAKDVDRGSYSDRAAMLKSAEQGGRLKDTMESGEANKVKSIGNKINPATGERCDFYVNPITNKEVFCKPGQKVSKGDHVTPSGTVKPKV